jgi:FAD synthase
LGYIISDEGKVVDREKVDAIMEWPTATNAQEERKIMVLTGYYRRFIEDFSKIANMIMELQKKKRISLFGWRNVWKR